MVMMAVVAVLVVVMGEEGGLVQRREGDGEVKVETPRRWG